MLVGMLTGWLSGTGTDMERPILSASPWYLASLNMNMLSGTAGDGSSEPVLLLYLDSRMARGVAGSPGAPDRDDPEPELLRSPWDSLFEGVRCRSCGRWPKGLAAIGYREAAGLLVLARISPGNGIFGADGLRASERRRASSSAAASSFLFCSFRSVSSSAPSVEASEAPKVLLERR